MLTGDDEAAEGVTGALDASGRRAPSEVALIAFDDRYGVVDLMSLLTIIRPPNKGVGQVATQHLWRCSAGEKGERNTRLETTLVIHKYCGSM